MNKCVIILTSVAVILMHIGTVLSAESENETDNDEDSLKVEVIDKPLSCETSSQRGNVLKLHYIGYFLDGEKFDSRLGSSKHLKTIVHKCV